MSGYPRHVVVVGRDAALWLTAATMKAALGPAGVAVTAIELPTRLGPASVYASLPAVEALHTKLEVDEAALLRATGGSFSLGWNIAPPGRKPFFLAHGAYGAPIDGADFFPYWLKAQHFGLQAAFEDFSPTAMAARHGRLLLPDEQLEQFGRTDYGYHLPAINYVALLKSRAAKLGVSIRQALEVSVERDSEGALIGGIRPDCDPLINGDLYIDASGPEAALIGSLPGADIEDWSSYFPLAGRLTARGPRFSSVPAYGEVRLSGDGWTLMLAAQGATHVVHAFGERERAEEDAAKVSGLSLQDVLVETVASGARVSPWVGNCVAIGAAACALDPIFDLDLHAVQLGIVHLLSLFPTTPAGDAERAEYNRIVRSHYERLRDFQAAFYALSATSSPVPETLHEKLDAFRARGVIAPKEDETFAPDQWRALFVGFGLLPDTWAPTIETTSPERMKQELRRILGFVSAKVLEQPTHDRYLADIGANEAA